MKSLMFQYHIGARMPFLARKALNANVMHEECWTAFPYTKTIVFVCTSCLLLVITI